MNLESRVLLFLILLFLMLIDAHPSVATCSCSSGPSSSYNFLGDPSFDVDMMSFDEFSRASYVANMRENSDSSGALVSEVAADTANDAGEDEEPSAINNSLNISLDLDEDSHIDLILFPVGKDLFGRGHLAREGIGAIEMLGAVGTQDENRLILELVSLEGALYRFDLQKGGAAVLGDYVKVMPVGEAKRGTAIGVLEFREVGNEGI